MPLFYIPPYATLENNSTTIEVNGQNVQVAEWAAEFSVGFNFPSLLPPFGAAEQQQQQQQQQQIEEAKDEVSSGSGHTIDYPFEN